MAVQPKITAQAFEEFISLRVNSDRRFELVDGEIVEKTPTEEHGYLASLLNARIFIYLEKNPIGRVVVEARYRMPKDEHNAYLPNVSFTSTERLQPLVKSGAVPHMPDLAIEIKSPNDKTLDMRKRAWYYLENGSRMVWLVFPHKQQIEVHTAEDIQTLTINDLLDGSDVLPEFTLALKDIFTEQA
jgi:Uma2 family endonuclease